MLTIIDNYDSFTYNLVHYFGDLGVDARVYRNDEKSAAQVLGENPEAIVMSPGPCTPNEAGICLELVEKNKGRIPLLGVCLGHQTIGQAFGGRVIRAPVLMHGKLSKIYHEGTSLFKGLDSGFEATRYHSLIVEAETLPACLSVTARTADGLIMALEHKSEPVFGVQFHPESIASANGHAILANFLILAGVKWEPRKKGLKLPNLQMAPAPAAAVA
jgi:anthranilate synthase component 2